MKVCKADLLRLAGLLGVAAGDRETVEHLYGRTLHELEQLREQLGSLAAAAAERFELRGEPLPELRHGTLLELVGVLRVDLESTHQVAAE